MMNVDVYVEQLRDLSWIALKFIALLLLGYVVSCIIAGLLGRVLRTKALTDTLVKYGAMTTKLWKSITTFLSKYVQWLILVAILTVTKIPIIDTTFAFMVDLLWFIVLTIAGLMVGGFLCKIIKDSLEAIGLEAWLKKYKLADAIGGMSLSSILAGIVKWYIVLVFISTGIEQILPAHPVKGMPALAQFMTDLMVYIPGAILGTLVMIAALLVADFVGDGIKRRKLAFSEAFALVIESIIVFFGAVLALPKFGITDVSVLTDSFKILMVGLSLGLAIAIGLGLKDSISDVGKKYEKQL